MAKTIECSVLKPSTELANKFYEAARAVQLNGGMNAKGLAKSENELKEVGIDLTKPGMLDRLCETGAAVRKTMDNTGEISLSAPTDSSIGINTFEISNALIQDASPDNDIENSPLSVMMPFKNVSAVEYQQDILESNYGYADGSAGVNGDNSVVDMLTSMSNKYKGYLITEQSFIEGYALTALRELGTSDTARKGYIQKVNYQNILLRQRQSTGLELNRYEMLLKGSWTYRQTANPAIVRTISGQIPATNTTNLSQSLGSYNTTTNVFTRNAGNTANALLELGATLTGIKNMGLEIDYIVIDNISYNAIFSSSAITSQTQYVAMNSNNDVMGVRRNLFRLTTIPALQGVDLLVDNRALKFARGKTSPANTRPLLWGKTVTSSSFRALIVVKQNGLTKVGDFAFFPNPYMRNTEVSGGKYQVDNYGGGIALITQDLSVQDITNQKIQMFSGSASAPVIYQGNLVFTFGWNVSITS